MFNYGVGYSRNYEFSYPSYNMSGSSSIPEHARITASRDSYVSSTNNKNHKKNQNKTLEVLGKIALAIVGAAAIYKGHNIISKGVGRIGKAAHAYKNTHANFSLKGLGRAGKEIGSSVGKAATSVVKVPCKLLSETAKIFKKTVK